MEIENIPTIEIHDYDIKRFTRAVFEIEDKRCRYCYESRMEVVAKAAKEEKRRNAKESVFFITLFFYSMVVGILALLGSQTTTLTGVLTYLVTFIITTILMSLSNYKYIRQTSTTKTSTKTIKKQ